jgi:fluoroquinolone resistance protein
MENMDLLSLIGQKGPIVDRQLNGEDLEELHIVEAEFRDCRFSDCHFDHSRIRSTAFLNCRFVRCSFKEAEFSDCLFVDGEKQTGSVWEYCTLSETKFTRSNLSMNRMVKCDAYLLALTECAAMGLQFEAEVHRKISKKLMMGGLRISKCKMQYAVFAPSNLDESTFESSDLRDCSFAGCNLARASFRGSSLNNTDFSDATLDGTILAQATFDSLDLASMASYRAAVVSRDQHENILSSLGLLTID